MKYTHEAPKLPKLPFFAADLVLIATSLFIGYRSATPLATAPLLAITLCAFVGVALTVIPFLADYARRQDAELTDRQNQIAALARTTSESAEQLSIAAAGLNDLAAASKQNLDSINQLPALLQKRIDDLTQQLASATPSSAPAANASVTKEDLNRLEATVEKITRSLAKLETTAKAKTDDLATTEKQLAASEKDLAASLARAATQITAFAATATATAVTAASAAERLAALPVPVVTSPTVAPTPPPSTGKSSRNKSTPPPAPSIPPIPIVAETPPPAPEPDSIRATAPVTPLESSQTTTASAPATPPSEPDPAPVIIAAAAPEPIAAAPAIPEPAAVEPVRPSASAPAPIAEPVPPAESTTSAAFTPAAEVFTATSPDAADVPVSEPETPKAPRARKPKTDDTGFDLGLTSEAQEATESSLSSDGFTRLIATAYIGIGNKLYIRGEGPGLSWEKGIPLQFVSIGKWRWETPDATAPVKAKLYKNDQIECSGLGSLTLEPGRQHEVNAGF